MKTKRETDTEALNKTGFALFLAELERTKCKTIAPEDPDDEGMNDLRSSYAEEALIAYFVATGSELETAIKDLIGDLGHFCDRHGMNLSEQLELAAGMYAEETCNKGEQFEEGGGK